MDNFEIEEAPGFTFVPTGGGVIYDHHPGENDLSFSFPEPISFLYLKFYDILTIEIGFLYGMPETYPLGKMKLSTYLVNMILYRVTENISISRIIGIWN